MKYKQLAKALEKSNLFMPEKLLAVMDDAKLTPVFELGEKGFLLADVVYTGLFEIEQLTAEPFTIFALIMLWLNEHDEDRSDHEELQGISWDITTEDDGQVTLALGIVFKEAIYLTESDNGEFNIDGTRYSLGEGQAGIAEKMGLSASVLAHG